MQAEIENKKHIESHWISQKHKWDIHQENSMVIKKDKSPRVRKQPWCRHVNNLRDYDYVRLKKKKKKEKSPETWVKHFEIAAVMTV